MKKNMNMNKTHNKSLAGNFIISVIFALVLAACETPPAADYRDAYPLVTGEEAISLVVEIPVGKNDLTFKEKESIKAFANDYLMRGKGTVTIETNTAGNRGGGLIPLKLQTVRQELMKEGVRNAEILLTRSTVDNMGKDNMTLSFTANTVKVPECGDWSSASPHDWSNQRHSNFGCSIQRNIGLTIADPGDLNKAKPVSARSSNEVVRDGGNILGGKETGSKHAIVPVWPATGK